MKSLLLIAAFFAATIGSALGQAPASVAGCVYRATETGFPGLGLRPTLILSILLSADGTYKEIVVRGVVTGSFPVQSPTYYSLPPYIQPLSGTYTYQKTGTNTGLLILSNGEISEQAALGADSINLTFLTSGSGQVSEAYQNFSGTFSISTASGPGSVPLYNVSTLSVASPGAPAVVGFILNGTQDVLIRVIGPSLAAFGIAKFLTSPGFTLNGPNGNQYTFPYGGGADGAGWSATTAGASTQQQAWQLVGAFPLTLGSADISEVVTLPAGPYSIVAQPATGGGGGNVLIETYILP